MFHDSMSGNIHQCQWLKIRLGVLGLQ